MVFTSIAIMTVVAQKQREDRPIPPTKFELCQGLFRILYQMFHGERFLNRYEARGASRTVRHSQMIQLLERWTHKFIGSAVIGGV